MRIKVQSYPRGRSVRGFTLIEVLIVVALIGLMASLATMGFGAGRAAEVTRATNQIANTIRYAYDKSRVTGEYYRLLMNLDKGTFALQVGDDRMFLPATDRDGKIRKVEQKELDARADRDRRAEEQYNRSITAKIYEAVDGGDTGGAHDPFAPTVRKVPRRKPPIFASFEKENELSELGKPFSVPEGARITYVRTAEDLEPIKKGEASIFFFPRGRTQEAHIVLEDTKGETVMTIKVQPLTGRVTIHDGREELSLPDDPTKAMDELGKRQGRRSW